MRAVWCRPRPSDDGVASIQLLDIIAEETSKPSWSADDEMSVEFVLRELAQRVGSNTGGPVHMLRSLADQALTEKGVKHE
ncbi:hypothetical protein ANCCAN_11586 [Ancylostoma caninum]|uniref:Uncharacterized protein n=1 Tax=Ancylostoma caninum TaxID=29170 RepID=A0A368GHU0_ANCCA|nr:hypothetical protein ANCCAN_11586 [Ancylostoma caninum]